jgi:hypothetical protein
MLRALAAAALFAAPAAWAADAFTYRAIDAYGRRVELGTFVVERNGAPRIASAKGVDPARAGALLPGDLRLRPERLVPGERWEDRAVRIDPQTGERREVRLAGRIIGTETIVTPAGTFETVLIERRLLLGDAGRYRTETRRTEREWYAPQLGAPVRTEIWEEFSDPTITRILQPFLTRNRELYELVSTAPGSRAPAGS